MAAARQDARSDHHVKSGEKRRMNANTVITAWKDPALRAELRVHDLLQLPEHPSGRSPFEGDPGKAAGGMAPGTLQTLGPLTSVMSCNLSCSETMWDGSCDFFTYGCC